MDVIDTTGPRKHFNAQIQGTVIALYTLTGVFGALSCIYLGDKLGRRGTIFLAALIQAVGCIISASAFAFGQFIVGRIFLGIGTGQVIATCSVWQSELSKASSRGQHVSAFGIFCGFGLALALWLDFATSYASSSFSWRFPLAFPIVLSAIVMAFIFTLPDSPRWLIKCGRETEAREILSLVHDVDPNDSSISQEITDIKLSLDLAGNTSLRSLFRMGKQRTLHRVLLGSLAQIMLQMTGVNSITYYASTIYEVNLGFSATEARILAAASQFCIIIGSIICSWTVDHLGRRTLMLASAASQCVCFAFLTGLSSNPDNKAALKACVFFLYLYYICYVLGFLGIPFLYASEIAPVSQRAAVCGISTAVSWLFNFLVAEVTPVAFTDIGYRYFIVYAVLNAAFVPTIYFAFPETAGRDLEEIDEIFAEATGIWDAVKVSKKLPRRRLADFRDRDEVEKVEGELGIKGIDGPGTEAEHVELKDG